MGLFLGIDLGTTTLSVVVLDVAAGCLLHASTTPHGADCTTADDRARGRAEVDIQRMQALTLRLVREAIEAVAARRDELRAVGVTGQQHGVALLDANGRPVGPAITWQDRRVLDLVPGTSETWLERVIRLAGGESAFERMGCVPSRGYLGATLYWLQQQGRIPQGADVACFVPDTAVTLLTGARARCDPTNGGSSGLLDVVNCQWDWGMIKRLGLPTRLLPAVQLPGTVVGELRGDLLGELGLDAPLPVCVAIGDNQAAAFGALRDPEASLSLNVGTGAQISAVLDAYRYVPSLQTRYFPGGRYLMVGAGLFGGRSYAYLRELFRQVGEGLLGVTAGGDLYDRMNVLASAVPSGCDGLRCSPLFTGSLLEPELRASFTGLTPQNLTPGHLTRALLEGMAEVFYEYYKMMLPFTGARRQ
ncbi:MAG: hypothetical protein GX557_08875, partial [Chloroflexi bacterium]|nr:hypothetical protein [Chloroflexota bacterium]